MKLCRNQKVVIYIIIIVIAIWSYFVIPSPWTPIVVAVVQFMTMKFLEWLFKEPEIDEEKLGKVIVRETQKKKEENEKRLRQRNLILNDLNRWIKKTIFSNIKYDWVKAEPISHKDPNDLPYFNQDVKVLKAYGAITEWEKGKTISDRLKTDGVESLQKFHRIVNKKLEKLPLKKSLEIGTLSEPYYSVPRIHEAIFEEISGNKSGFVVRPLSRMIPPPDLYSLDCGATTLACGKKKTMNRLKKIIKELIEDDGVRIKIESFNDVKKKLDSIEPFMEFEKKLKKAIADFRWNQEFNP